MTAPQRREDETMEGYVIRLIRSEERERCAGIIEKFIRLCGSVNGREAASDILTRIRDLKQ